MESRCIDRARPYLRGMPCKGGTSSLGRAQRLYRRTDMKRFTLLSFYGAFLLAALVSLAPAAQAHNRSCSQAGVAGEWGYTYNMKRNLTSRDIPPAAGRTINLG